VDTYCGRCGLPLDEAAHDDCRRLLELEPPRYCPDCRRRMKVQVSPMGWTATCAEHGEVTSGSDQGSTTAP
jgi:hypothetical protein